LYFKTDTHTVEPYDQRQMPSYQSEDGPSLRDYRRVPAEVIGDDERLGRWASRALIVANRQLDH
jgi:hypothetical protein